MTGLGPGFRMDPALAESRSKISHIRCPAAAYGDQPMRPTTGSPAAVVVRSIIWLGTELHKECGLRSSSAPEAAGPCVTSSRLPGRHAAGRPAEARQARRHRPAAALSRRGTHSRPGPHRSRRARPPPGPLPGELPARDPEVAALQTAVPHAKRLRPKARRCFWRTVGLAVRDAH